MRSMVGDVKNRVQRLPKPSKPSEALQPLFEAVSNAIHATESFYGPDNSAKGHVVVRIENLTDADDIQIIVSDNGIGLTDKRFDAFCTTDTPFKISRGGKGIGRLLWLDAFNRINVRSIYRKKNDRYQRKFAFRLEQINQISDETDEQVDRKYRKGTDISFKGLRGTAYRKHFPVQRGSLVRHFGSHFLAEFIMGSSPTVELDVDGKVTTFPDAVRELIVSDLGTLDVSTDDYPGLQLTSFICRKGASAEFDGTHQLHFVANGRTVVTRKIDGLLGIGKFGADKNHVYHGCVSGEFLDQTVNQERTHFNFDEATAEAIAKVCAEAVRSGPLKLEITDFDNTRRDSVLNFLQEYPSFYFENIEQLMKRIPKNAVKAEQFAQALVATRVRRDQTRNLQVEEIVRALHGKKTVTVDFAEAVRDAATEVQEEERRQLTEYVVRRKMALDVLEGLISKLRTVKDGTSDFFLEKTLHQFICPMRIRSDDPSKVERSKHDLWIVDERMAFAKYFASDVPFKDIIANSDDPDKPDFLLYEQLYGLGLGDDEPLTKIVLIEFKKPGRRSYPDRYSPLNQVTDYLDKLVNGEVESFAGKRVRVSNDCIYYCYVIADIVGELKKQTNAWRSTADGRGKVIDLGGSYRGFVEVMEWQDLLNDARSRNHAFISAAGLRYDT